MSLYWIYAFNIVVNSTLSFFTSLLLIEFFACLFRIKHPRIKAIYRTLPFFKIIFDLYLYHISKWALLHGVNPILAEKGTRTLSLLLNPFTGIQFSMKDGKTFSIADVIALSVDPIWIQGIVLLAGLGSLIATLSYLRRIFQERNKVSQILTQAIPLSFPWIKQKHISMATSTEISAPCIIRKTILFPESLLKDLSNEEVEAIIAHEIAHLRWKDCTLRIICSLIASLFWWIPTKRWQKRIEEMQEQASDATIDQFGISNTALAGAILKTAWRAKEAQSQLTFSFTGRKSHLNRRMKMLLKPPSSQSLRWKIIQYGLLFCAMASVLLGTLWIF